MNLIGELPCSLASCRLGRWEALTVDWVGRGECGQGIYFTMTPLAKWPQVDCITLPKAIVSPGGPVHTHSPCSPNPCLYSGEEVITTPQSSLPLCDDPSFVCFFKSCPHHLKKKKKGISLLKTRQLHRLKEPSVFVNILTWHLHGLLELNSSRLPTEF